MNGSFWDGLLIGVLLVVVGVSFAVYRLGREL